MENENQTTNPMPPVPVQQKPRHTMRNSLIVLAMLILSAVGYMSYKNPTLFSASLTGGSDANVDTDMYISNDYKASSGDSVYINVKAGKALAKLSALKVTFVAPSSMIDMVSISKDGTVLKDASFTTITPATGEFTVTFTIPTTIDVSDNAVLFKMLVSLKSSLNQGDTVVIARKDNSTYSSITTDPGGTRVPTFTDGKITIGTTAEACKTMDCGDHAACDQTAGKCVCFKGYDEKYLCNACSEGYTGFPDCKVDVLSGVNGIVLTFNKDTIDKLTAPDRVKAYSVAYVLINSSAAAGKTITLEGSVITIPASTAGTTEAEKINNITDQLKSSLAVAGVNVTKVTSAPGLLKLTASTGNADNSLDGITTNSGEAIIVPGLENKIVLNPTASYQLRVIGKKDDGSALDINFNNLKWQPQPVNRLNNSALAGGLLEKGDKSGVTPLYAQIEKANGSKIDSNQITVEVPSGPIVEYIHIIGSKPLERGGRVTLSAKISDVDQISDIKDIRTSIVRSAQTTYAGINGDSGAVWFTATPVKTEVATTDSGTQQTASSGATDGASASSGSSGPTSSGSSSPSSSSSSATEYYRVYSIPVEIPQDENMADGDYKLVLELTDTAGHVASSVLTIKIGAKATGDVDGNGKVNMLDVIAAFQIASGADTSPDQSELQAADIDNNGKVTMLDVITLFNQLK